MNTDVPLVSIGVPTYNRPEGLRAALQCLLRQTYPNLEIIVSDNCSTNAEVEPLMQEMIKLDPRIRYYRQSQNIGAISNFKFVFRKATGKYFLWAADDDLCEDAFIEKLVGCMESHPEIVLCATDVKSIDENNNPGKDRSLESIRLSADWNHSRELFFRYPTSEIFFSIYGLFKTEVLRRCDIGLITGWKGMLTNGEVPFLAQVATHGRIASIPEALKIFRWHSSSTYHQEIDKNKGFDAMMLRMVIRLKLVKVALLDAKPLDVKLSSLRIIVKTFLESEQIGRTIWLNIKRITRKCLPDVLVMKIKIYTKKIFHKWRI